ncbi:hypothetical protein [Enhygromyxa salina]|uniref:Uncharacterized protein n=1 Tax=Enhygromyxa salina TaxID=215803 RepID=A0A2S9YT18_9BACT|nr:hypothetical protein [Enhygromyxa salina]PRQ08247.1 hypothetical protein ENSA7_18690 [Enhygromyxa salina]
MGDPLATLEAAARGLAASPIPTTALVIIDDPRRGREAVERLVGTVLLDSRTTWRVQWLDLAVEPATIDEARKAWSSGAEQDSRPLLVVLDLSQAAPTQAERHEAQLRDLNASRDLLPHWGGLGALVFVVPSWLGRRFADLAPDTYSILGPIVQVEWHRPWGEVDGSGFLEAMRKRFEARLDEHADAPSRYVHGTYELGYRFEAPHPRLPGDEVLERLAAIHGYTGWRPWWVPTRDEIRPRIVDHGSGLSEVECWMFENQDRSPAHSDYWLTSNDGNLYLLRGYDEDSHPDRIELGTAFSVSLPVWRVGEALLHVASYTAALGVPEATVDFFARWSGLRGRRLTGWPDAWDHAQGQSTIDTVSADVEFVASSVESLSTLTSLVCELTAPVLAGFDGHRLTRGHVQKHLEQLLTR